MQFQKQMKGLIKNEERNRGQPRTGIHAHNFNFNEFFLLVQQTKWYREQPLHDSIRNERKKRKQIKCGFTLKIVFDCK